MEVWKPLTKGFGLIEAIREKSIGPQEYQQTKALLELVNQQPITHEPLYRGVDDISENVQIGDIIEDVSFQCKSCDVECAEVFAQNEPYTVIRMTYPQSTKGFYVPPEDGFPGEKEVITFPRERFRVHDIQSILITTVDGTFKHRRIYAEYIGNLYSDKEDPYDDILEAMEALK